MVEGRCSGVDQDRAGKKEILGLTEFGGLLFCCADASIFSVDSWNGGLHIVKSRLYDNSVTGGQCISAPQGPLNQGSRSTNRFSPMKSFGVSACAGVLLSRLTRRSR